MELMIFNRDLEYLGDLDLFSSFIWRRKKVDIGDFELTCNFSKDAYMLLKRQNIIYKRGEDEAGYIDYMDVDTNEQGMEIIKVHGKFLTDYLSRRSHKNTFVFEGNVEEAMRKLVDINCTNTTTDRIIPNLILGDIKGFKEVIALSKVGSVADILKDISNTSGLGYKLKFSYKSKKLIFEIYKGKNRSIDHKENSYAIFSLEEENILKQKYTTSINNYKNVAIIVGKNNKNTSIGIYSGLDRLELFVDATDIDDKEKIKVKNPQTGAEEEIEVEIPWARYEPMLLQRGKEKLAECKEIETFDSTVNTNTENLIYKLDYDLGDIVTVQDKRLGVRINTEITEIEEIYEQDGLKVNITFGNNVPTLIDKIKQMAR